jgi:hypothetical protein
MATVKTSACTFCSSADSEMINPRRLPCGHRFCEKCLSGQLGTDGQIICPTCNHQVLEQQQQVSDELLMYPASLPLDYGPHYSCTACVKKGEPARAVFYCIECDKRMCDKHAEVSVLLTNFKC